MSEEPRFAPNGNRLPERLPVGHRLVDTTKQQWLIGPSIGCGGFGDIYLTRQFNDSRSDLKNLTQKQIIQESRSWTNVIKFEHFSGPLFAEINFYLRCARKETIEEYMSAKKLKHLGMPRFVASGIYDPLRNDNPPPVCKNTPSLSVTSNTSKTNGVQQPAAKRGRPALVNGARKTGQLANGKQRKTSSSSAQSKEKKYRFLVLQRFGDDVQKIWTRANEHFDMKSAFNIALKVIDTLEYIHSHGYVHADVKASNLLIDLRDVHKATGTGLANGGAVNDDDDGVDHSQPGSGALCIQNGKATKSVGRQTVRSTKATAVKRERPKSVTNGHSEMANEDSDKSSIEAEDQIYLVDFGLVERFYSKDGVHREHVEDQRRANNGTVEFSSRDAHIGAFSRRSDLESLAYNLLYWVSGGRLPWTNVLKDHQLVEVSKKWYMDNLEVFVNYCFNEDAYPIDPLRLLKGLDPSTDPTHSSNSSQCQTATNGRSNGRTNHNTGSTVSTTSTRASTTSRISKSSAKSKPSSKTSSSISTSSSSSTHDSIMCAALYDFLKYITKLEFADEPDYYLLKSILSNALGGGASARTARKRGNHSLKKTPPKSPKCENPTPAMREILRKMKLSSKKH